MPSQPETHHSPPPRPPPPPPPAFTNITYPPALEPYNVPARTWLDTHSKSWDGLATGALVFDDDDDDDDDPRSNSSSRVLLLQRAAHDSMPNLWETPGGAADDADASLLAACARELWEEAGLEAVAFVRVVSEGADREPGSVFTNRSGTRVFCRFAFEVRVRLPERERKGSGAGGEGEGNGEEGEGNGNVKGEEMEVRIDPAEHQDYIWATEDEVKAQRVGEREIPITNGQMMRLILDGFRRRREEGGGI